MSIKTVAKTIVAGAKAHKPEIMIGVGLVAGAGAVFMAVKETPACLDAFDKAEAEAPKIVEVTEEGKENVIVVPLNWKQKGLIYLKSYKFTIALEAAAIFLVCCGAKIRLDWHTALIAVYGLKSAELDDLKQVISEQPANWKKKFTEAKAESHISKTTVEDVPAERMSDAEVPMPLPLFWDDQALVYFRMSEEDLRDAISEFTFVVSNDPFRTASMNDWMAAINHEPVLNGEYQLMHWQDDGALKYTQIGVKEAPTGEPARMMRFNWDYYVDERALSIFKYKDI